MVALIQMAYNCSVGHKGWLDLNHRGLIGLLSRSYWFGDRVDKGSMENFDSQMMNFYLRRHRDCFMEDSQREEWGMRRDSACWDIDSFMRLLYQMAFCHLEGHCFWCWGWEEGLSNRGILNIIVGSISSRVSFCQIRQGCWYFLVGSSRGWEDNSRGRRGRDILCREGCFYYCLYLVYRPWRSNFYNIKINYGTNFVYINSMSDQDYSDYTLRNRLRNLVLQLISPYADSDLTLGSEQLRSLLVEVFKFKEYEVSYELLKSLDYARRKYHSMHVDQMVNYFFQKYLGDICVKYFQRSSQDVFNLAINKQQFVEMLDYGLKIIEGRDKDRDDSDFGRLFDQLQSNQNKVIAVETFKGFLKDYFCGENLRKNEVLQFRQSTVESFDELDQRTTSSQKENMRTSIKPTKKIIEIPANSIEQAQNSKFQEDSEPASKIFHEQKMLQKISNTSKLKSNSLILQKSSIIKKDENNSMIYGKDQVSIELGQNSKEKSGKISHTSLIKASKEDVSIKIPHLSQTNKLSEEITLSNQEDHDIRKMIWKRYRQMLNKYVPSFKDEIDRVELLRVFRQEKQLFQNCLPLRKELEQYFQLKNSIQIDLLIAYLIQLKAETSLLKFKQKSVKGKSSFKRKELQQLLQQTYYILFNQIDWGEVVNQFFSSQGNNVQFKRYLEVVGRQFSIKT